MKKFLKSILPVAVILTVMLVLAITASAAVTSSGKVDASPTSVADHMWTYDSDTKVLTITGTSSTLAMKTADNKGLGLSGGKLTNDLWADFRANVTKVVIEAPITKISSSYLFAEMTDLECVVLPDTTIDIKGTWNIFRSDKKLKKICIAGKENTTADYTYDIQNLTTSGTMDAGTHPFMYAGTGDITVILPAEGDYPILQVYNVDGNRDFGGAATVKLQYVAGSVYETVAQAYVTANSAKYSAETYVPVIEATATGNVNEGVNSIIWNYYEANGTLEFTTTASNEILTLSQSDPTKESTVIRGWQAYANKITTVIFNEGITGLGTQRIFQDHTKLENVVIRSKKFTVTGPANYVFLRCYKLTTFGPEGTPEGTYDLRNVIAGEGMTGCTYFFGRCGGGAEITVLLPFFDGVCFNKNDTTVNWALDGSNGGASKVTFKVLAGSPAETVAKAYNTADSAKFQITYYTDSELPALDSDKSGAGSCNQGSLEAYTWYLDAETGVLTLKRNAAASTGTAKRFSTKENTVLTEIHTKYSPYVKSVVFEGWDFIATTDVAYPNFSRCETLNFGNAYELYSYSTHLFDEWSSLTTVISNLTSFKSPLPENKDITVYCMTKEAQTALDAQNYTGVTSNLFDGALSFNGYQVRITDPTLAENYNGLRALFSFDKTKENAYSALGLSLVEYGGLLTTKATYSIDGKINIVKGTDTYVPVIPQGGKAVYSQAIWSNGAWAPGSKILASSDIDSRIDYCLAAVKYVDNFTTDMYFCAYSVWTDAAGNEFIIYDEYESENEDFNKFTSIYDLYNFYCTTGIDGVIGNYETDPILKKVIEGGLAELAVADPTLAKKKSYLLL